MLTYLTHCTKKLQGIWFSLSIILVLVFHLATLLRYPATFVDEAQSGSAALAVVQSGSAMGALDRGVFDRIPGAEHTFSYLPAMAHALSVVISGEVSVLGLRLVNLAFGLILLIAVYFIGLSIGGKFFALLWLLVTGFSYIFSHATHIARVDVMAAAFSYGALAIYLRNSSHYLSRDLLAGIIFGLAFHFHPRALVVAPGIVVAMVFCQSWRCVVSKRCWSFALGAAISAGVYYFLYIAPYPEAFAKIQQLSYEGSRNPPFLNFDYFRAYRTVKYALARAYRPLQMMSWLVLAGFVLSLAMSYRNRESRMLALGFVALTFSLVCLVPTPLDLNLIVYSPAADMMVAFLFWRGFVGVKMPVWGVLAQGISGFILLSYIYVNSAFVLSFDGDCVAEQSLLQEVVSQHVQPQDAVMGPLEFWFALQKNEYQNWSNLVFLQRLEQGITLSEAFQQFAPDILLLNSRVRYFLSDEPRENPWYNNLRLSKTQFLEVVRRRGRLLQKVEGTCNGDLEIYRMQWQ